MHSVFCVSGLQACIQWTSQSTQASAAPLRDWPWMTQVSLCKETAVWPWEQAGGGGQIDLQAQTSTYALVTNQKKNAKVLLNQSRLLGAWLFAVRLPKCRRSSNGAFLFSSQTWEEWYNWCARTHRSERAYHFVSAQMVKVGFCWVISMTWYKPAVGARWIFICYWAFPKWVLCN